MRLSLYLIVQRSLLLHFRVSFKRFLTKKNFFALNLAYRKLSFNIHRFDTTKQPICVHKDAGSFFSLDKKKKLHSFIKEKPKKWSSNPIRNIIKHSIFFLNITALYVTRQHIAKRITRQTALRFKLGSFSLQVSPLLNYPPRHRISV